MAQVAQNGAGVPLPQLAAPPEQVAVWPPGQVRVPVAHDGLPLEQSGARVVSQYCVVAQAVPHALLSWHTLMRQAPLAHV